MARVDVLEQDFERLTVLGEIRDVGLARGEVLGEWPVGYGAQVGAMDVEEDAVAGAEDDDLVIGRGDWTGESE